MKDRDNFIIYVIESLLLVHLNSNYRKRKIKKEENVA